MALTLSLSQEEFRRVSIAAYENRRLYVFLVNLTNEGYNAETTVADWESIKITGQGYADYKELISPGAYSTTNQRYQQGGQTTGSGFIDAEFAASSAGTGFSYNRIVTVIQDIAIQRNISYVEISGNVATVTTALDHGLSPGDEVVIENAVNSTLNGTFSIVTCPTTTTFTYALTAGNLSSTASAGTVKKFTSNSYPHSVFTESPSVTVAPGQLMTYRIQIVLDD